MQNAPLAFEVAHGDLGLHRSVRFHAVFAEEHSGGAQGAVGARLEEGEHLLADLVVRYGVDFVDQMAEATTGLTNHDLRRFNIPAVDRADL